LPAFWLTYKPLSHLTPRGWPPEQMDALVEAFRRDPSAAMPLWRIASSRAATVGDRVYLFKQGSGPRGIFGVGELVEAPHEQTDPTDVDAGATTRARIRLHQLVNPAHEFLLDYEDIAGLLPDTLVHAQQSGNRVLANVAEALDARLSVVLRPIKPLLPTEADEGTFDPDSVGDLRARGMRAICLRRGQSEFRAALMAAYGRRCTITGCAVEDVLEAAHIYPYRGAATNHVSNGLLLRADIHTLFDCGLIGIDPRTRKVVVSPTLAGSSYSKLAGRPLREARSHLESASMKSLDKHFTEFLERNS
jgi:putative restriction endonuclease